MQPKSKRPARAGGSALDLEAEAFYETMSALLRAYQFRDRERACDYGISITECYGLDLIVAEGPMPVKELARRLRLDKSSASRTASSLERGGYVRREDDEDDMRAWKLKATAKGRGLNGRIRAAIVARQKELLARVDPRSRKQILWLLGMLTAQEIARQGCGK
jgi:DNA-binding MarR family transcriptional regulator